MEIRFITPEDDVLEISNIYEQSWKYAYKDIIPQSFLDSIPAGKWAGTISKGSMKSLVIEENGSLVGTAGICPSRWERFSGYGEIVSLYLLPEYIGKGYGRKLFERCVAELRSLGFSSILLWVLEENDRARRFYERNGMICSGEFIDDEIGGKPLRELMYILRTDNTKE